MRGAFLGEVGDATLDIVLVGPEDHSGGPLSSGKVSGAKNNIWAP